jgi:hypothetical protein
MSDIEILNQIKELASQLASSRNKRYVSEVLGDILSGRLDQWDREEMAKDFCEEDEEQHLQKQDDLRTNPNVAQ